MCSFLLMERHKLGLHDTWILREIFGPQRKEVILNWRKLHSEELHDLYFPLDISQVIRQKRMRLAGYVARKVEEERSTEVFGGEA